SVTVRTESAMIPLNVQYSPVYLDTLEKVRRVPVVTAAGRAVALGDIADVAVRKMPEMIRDDNGKLSGYIYVDLRDVTGPDYVDAARRYLTQNLTLPVGYSIEWTGLYQYAAAARARLRLVVPVTLAIIFGLLESPRPLHDAVSLRDWGGHPRLVGEAREPRGPAHGFRVVGQSG